MPENCSARQRIYAAAPEVEAPLISRRYQDAFSRLILEVMSAAQPKFTFAPLPSPALPRNIQDSLTKWCVRRRQHDCSEWEVISCSFDCRSMHDSMRLYKFRFDQHFHNYDVGTFLQVL